MEQDGLREGLIADSSLTGQTGKKQRMSGMMDRMQVESNWREGGDHRQGGAGGDLGFRQFFHFSLKCIVYPLATNNDSPSAGKK